MDLGSPDCGWRTSRRSFANGNCAEVAASWRKSAFSEAGNCVEAGSGERAVAVRDTTDRGGTVLVFPAAVWAAFTARIAGAP